MFCFWKFLYQGQMKNFGNDFPKCLWWKPIQAIVRIYNCITSNAGFVTLFWKLRHWSYGSCIFTEYIILYESFIFKKILTSSTDIYKADCGVGSKNKHILFCFNLLRPTESLSVLSTINFHNILYLQIIILIISIM